MMPLAPRIQTSRIAHGRASGRAPDIDIDHSSRWTLIGAGSGTSGKAVVRFQPAPQPSGPTLPDSYGETDDQGYYALKPAVPGRNDRTSLICSRRISHTTRCGSPRSRA